MPIYGYRCTQCGHELEVFQSMSAEPLRVCPECSGSLRKLLYPVGVQFKGSGFYTTDYKNGGSSSSSSSKSDGSSKSESTTSANGSQSSESNGSGSSDSKTSSASGGSSTTTSKE
ncbi:MAG TPA: FmdB family zinc ribbon protein [Candidatus Dormibacteraeota bacterium]|nr:FmdB family zinc ribbon protein [Candidatus Dormibacteraeota bacterium]